MLTIITVLTIQIGFFTLMFMYVNVKIKSQSVAKHITDKVEKVKRELQSFQDYAKSTEDYAAELYTKTESTFSNIEDKNNELTQQLHGWENVKSLLENMVSSLDSKQIHFNKLIDQVNIAEQQIIVLRQNNENSANMHKKLIENNNACEELLSKLDNVIQNSDVMMGEKFNAVTQDINSTINNVLETFTQRLTMLEQEECERIENKVSQIYIDYDAHIDKREAELDSKIETFENTIGARLEENERKTNQTQVLFQEEVSNIQQSMKEQISEFENKSFEIEQELSDNLKNYSVEYKEKSELMELDFEANIKQYSIKIAETKIALNSHAQTLLDKIDIKGNESIMMFKEDLDSKSHSLSSQLQLLDLQINEKISGLRQHADIEFNTLQSKLYEMSSVLSATEHESYDKTNKLQDLLDKVNAKMQADFEVLKEKQQLLDANTEKIIEEKELLEVDIKSLYEKAHAELSGELTAHITATKEEIKIKVDNNLQLLETHFSATRTDLQEHISTMKGNFATELQSEHENFSSKLQIDKAEFLSKVEKHNENLDKKLTEYNEGLNSKLSEYDTYLATTLEAHSRDAVSAYIETIEAHKADFNAKVVEVENTINEFKTQNETNSNEIIKDFTEVVAGKTLQIDSYVEAGTEKIAELQKESEAQQNNVKEAYLQEMTSKLQAVDESIEIGLVKIAELQKESEAQQNIIKKEYIDMIEEKTQAVSSFVATAIEKTSELQREINIEQNSIKREYFEVVGEKTQEVTSVIDIAVSKISELQKESEAQQHSVKEAYLQEVTGKSQEVDVSIEAALTKIAELQKESKAQHISVNDEYYALIETKMQNFSAIVNNSVTTIESLQQKAIDAIEQTQGEGIENQERIYNAHLEGIKNEIHAFEENAKGVADDIAHIKQESEIRLTSVHSEYYDSITNQYDKYENKVLTLTNKIDNFHKKNEDIQINANDKYLAEIGKYTDKFENTVRIVTQQISELNQSNSSNQQELQTEYASLRQEADIRRGEYEKLASDLTNISEQLNKEIESSKELYEDFNKKYIDVKNQSAILLKHNEEVQNRLVKTDNYHATIVATSKENKSIWNDMNQHSKQLKEIEAKLRNSMQEHKHTIADIKKIDRQVQKAHINEEIISQQARNIDKIKDDLSNIHNMQKTVKEFQDDLQSWDRDHKLLINTIDSLQSRTREIEQQCSTSEKNMQTWLSKLDITNNYVNELNNKYSKIQVINTKLDKIESNDILNNIDEYKEMQKNFLAQERNLLKSIDAADRKIEALGTVMNGTNKGTSKAKSLSSLSPDVQRNIIDLKRAGWTVESISKNFEISTAEVNLILQKNVVT